MGVRVYSKILSKTWPNNTLLLAKCVRAWDDYKSGSPIGSYEYVPKAK